MEKKVFLLSGVLLLVGLYCSPAFAGDAMGPPTAGLTTGQFRVGLDYAWSESDVELSYGGTSVTAKNAEANRILANLGYGVTDDLEVYIRLGGANLEQDEFDGDYGFAYGFGTKVTLAKDSNPSWGALFQIGWTKSEDTYTDTVFGFGKIDMEADFYEIQIAAGPTYEMQGWCIYGGPMLYFLDGDLDVKTGRGSISIDIEEESCFGGYVGAEFDLAQNCLAYVEGQFTSDAVLVGTGVAWKF